MRRGAHRRRPPVNDGASARGQLRPGASAVRRLPVAILLQELDCIGRAATSAGLGTLSGGFSLRAVG